MTLKSLLIFIAAVAVGIAVLVVATKRHKQSIAPSAVIISSETVKTK